MILPSRRISMIGRNVSLNFGNSNSLRLDYIGSETYFKLEMRSGRSNFFHSSMSRQRFYLHIDQPGVFQLINIPFYRASVAMEFLGKIGYRAGICLHGLENSQLTRSDDARQISRTFKRNNGLFRNRLAGISQFSDRTATFEKILFRALLNIYIFHFLLLKA